MVENNTNASETVSRRNVLKTMGGLIAGSTALAGLGAGRGAAETEEGLRIEVQEANEEYIAVEVQVPHGVYMDDAEFSQDTFLGHAEQFVIHEEEDAVSLPEHPEEVLATPVETEQLDEQTYRMYFRTGDIDLSEVEEPGNGGNFSLGLGMFPRQTVSGDLWDTDSVRFERVQNNL